MEQSRNMSRYGNMDRRRSMNRHRKLQVFWLAMLSAVIVLTACGGKAPKNYEVLVNDPGGKPVSGVTIQFCSDTECLVGKTDENGIAVFEKEGGSYTVHVLKVPEGYAEDKAEYPAPEKPGRVTIVLN